MPPDKPPQPQLGPGQQRDMNLLHPTFRPRIERWLAKARSAGFNVRVTETFRTMERQRWLYASGRSRPGPIVTNTLKSSHRMGIAVDIVLINSNGSANWDVAAYQRLYRLVPPKDFGLATLEPFEWVHLELPGGWSTGSQLGIVADVVVGSRWST